MSPKTTVDDTTVSIDHIVKIKEFRWGQIFLFTGTSEEHWKCWSIKKPNWTKESPHMTYSKLLLTNMRLNLGFREQPSTIEQTIKATLTNNL